MTRTQEHRWRTVRQDCYQSAEDEQRTAAMFAGFQTAMDECVWMQAVFCEPKYPGKPRKIKGKDTR